MHRIGQFLLILAQNLAFEATPWYHGCVSFIHFDSIVIMGHDIDIDGITLHIGNLGMRGLMLACNGNSFSPLPS